MDDRTTVTRTNAATVSASQQAAYRGGTELRRRFPTVAYLRNKARTRIPYFAFEYGDGGAGADTGIAHNWAALDAVELVPRYGVMPALPTVEVELFGRQLCGPARHRADGRPRHHLAGRRHCPGASRAAGTRALYARHRRRHHHRAGRRNRAGCPVVPALSHGAERSPAGFRAPSPLRGGRRACVRAHGRRAGAHGAPARGRGRASAAESSRPARA